MIKKYLPFFWLWLPPFWPAPASRESTDAQVVGAIHPLTGGGLHGCGEVFAPPFYRRFRIANTSRGCLNVSSPGPRICCCGLCRCNTGRKSCTGSNRTRAFEGFLWFDVCKSGISLRCAEERPPERFIREWRNLPDTWITRFRSKCNKYTNILYVITSSRQ
jgi:hypothetical protein